MRALPNIILSAISGLLLAATLAAQQPQPVPVVVNTDPSGQQTLPLVVSGPDGSILVAWQDSSSQSNMIKFQGFDRLGHRLGPVGTAGAEVSGGVFNPTLAVNVLGQAVLSWQERLAVIDRVVFRKLNIDGSPLTGVLPLSSLRLLSGIQPDAAPDSSGNTLLVWSGRRDSEDSDIFGNFYPFDDTTGTFNQDTLTHGWIADKQINEVAPGEQDAPAMAVDRKGRILVAWRDFRTDSLGIFCRAFTDRGDSLGSLRLNEFPPAEITALGEPAVTGAGVGLSNSTFLVSWVETDTLGRNRLMLVKVQLNPFAFPPSVEVDTEFSGMVRQRSGLEFQTPALDATDEGSAVLVWTEIEAGRGQLWGMMFDASGVLPPLAASRLTSNEPGFGVPALNPDVSVDNDGSFAMVWQDTSGGDSDIRLQRYSSGGQVQQPVYLSPGSGGGDNRSVTFLDRPALGYEMYWEHDAGDTIQVMSLRYDYAGRPLAAAQVVNPAVGNQRRPVTAANTSGLQVLAWEEYSGGYRVMVEIMRQDGTVLRQPFALASSSSSHLGSLTATVSDSGGIFVIWERWSQNSGAPDLVLARLDSLGNSIGSQITVASATGGGGRLASAAVSPQGNLMVAWRQGRSAAANAHVRARVYSSTGSVLRDRIIVSRDTVEFLGSMSRPEVAASSSSGNFLVLWQEFFSDRNLLYHRIYDSTGDSLQLPGAQWRERLGSSTGLSDNARAFGSPAAAVDSAGGFLVLWSESSPSGSAGLYGARFDPQGAVSGSQFQVPGVQTASLPVIGILDQQRLALAWQDTLGNNISFLALQLHFHTLLGRVLLASSAGSQAGLFVHVEGAIRDSAALAGDGSFRFEGLLDGSYRVWVSSSGSELPGTSREIDLSANDPPVVDISVAADLRGQGPQLPRAGQVSLAQNNPNPFNPSTTISFTVPENNGPLHVRLAVYGLRGELVRSLLEGSIGPGTHRLEWDGLDGAGRRVASGVYFLRLSAGGETRVRKMIMLK